MDKLKDKLWDELEEIAKKHELGAGDLELVHKLTDTIKNIDKICMREDGEGYSQAGEWDAEIRGVYGNGSSHANRGKHLVRSHYSRAKGRDDSGPRRGGHGYSRDDGRSEMMEHIEAAMDAATPEDREMIKRFIRQLENA